MTIGRATYCLVDSHLDASSTATLGALLPACVLLHQEKLLAKVAERLVLNSLGPIPGDVDSHPTVQVALGEYGASNTELSI